MPRHLTAAAALALLLGGCAGSGGVPASSTSGPTSTSTSAASTTTSTAPATTTAAGPVFVVGAPGVYPPDPLPGSNGASGSGCAPPSGPLPDGVWFGKLLEVTPAQATFDPACFYFGDAAEAAAAADGEEELVSPHYLRNPLPDLVQVPIAPGTPAYSIDNTVNPLGFLTFSLEEWPATNGGYTLCPGEGCAVWLFVNGGLVTEILEQYLP